LSEFSCSDSILKQNGILERSHNSKQTNLKLNNGNKTIKNNDCFNNVNINLNNIDNNINSENKSNIISVGGKAISQKLAIIINNKTNGKETSINAYSIKNKSNANKELKLANLERKLSYDNILVKCNADKIFQFNNIENNNSLNGNVDKNKTNNKQIFSEINSYFNNTKDEIDKKVRNKSKSVDLGNKILIEVSSKSKDVTRRISNILYNLIIKNDDFSNGLRFNQDTNKAKNNLSKFDSMDKLVNLIKSEKKANYANVIGPTPNIKEIKKNFAFNKSCDSFDVQSEFLISYLRDEELVSQISNCIKNTESNQPEDENEKENKNREEDKYNQNKNNNQRSNFIKNKNFQEKVLLNINNKYSKTANNPNKNDFENKKNVNFNNADASKNKKLETIESQENNNIKENKNCCFFKCQTNSNNNPNHVNSNIKIKKGKKQDANINSYYSTFNNTKRSTNHSFKSIRLNDSLTKFRKRRLSNCTSDKDSKCPTKGSISNLTASVSANNPNKKDKKVNCRCEIF
jgi:hypothetical protein